MALLDIVRPRITELGKIKIGGKEAKVRQSQSGGTWRAPEKYDHFVITGLSRNSADDLVREQNLMDSLQKYADPVDGKLRELPIGVLSNNLDDIIQSRYVYYVGKRVAAHSDGVTLTSFWDRERQTWRDEPHTMEWKPDYADAIDNKGKKIFKLHTVFNCVITSDVARWGGVYKFRTTSKITASQLTGSLLFIRELTGGILRGIPLRLVVRPATVEPDGKRTIVYVVHVEVVGSDLQQIQSNALERAKFELQNKRELDAMQLEYRKALRPPGVDETATEQADAAEEFHPEETPTKTSPATVDPLAASLGLVPEVNGKHEPQEATV